MEAGAVKDPSSEGIERLLDTDATSFERELLEASALERPSPELLLTMQRGLGIAPDVAPPQLEPQLREPAAPPATATGASAAWSSATLLKVGVGAAIGSGVVIAALSLTSRPGAPAPASAPREAARASAPEAPAPPPPRSSAAAAPEAPASTPDPARELRLEIELLDHARAALSASEPERARVLLEQYAERFPAGTLAREAQLLRGKIARGDARPRARLPAAPDPATLDAPAPTPARP
jgi:hypothetical protein